MRDQSEVPFFAIEEALERTAGKYDGSITRENLLRELGAPESPALLDKIERALAGDGRFFSDNAGNGILRSAFFKNFLFPVTPDAWEIENGILFPGHRFAPYLNEEIFPSEVTLLAKNAEMPIEKRELTAPLGQIFHYHMLLGSEQVFDFFVADSAANAHLPRAPQPESLVTLQIFDLAEFYKRNRFSEGDALLCCVEDYEKGIIRFEMLSADDRSNRDVKAFVAGYEKALEKVFDRFENYLEIPEQLSWAFYYGAETRPAGIHAASLDEFVRLAENVEIDFEGEHTVLARRHSSAGEDDAPELPEGVSLSKGETRELPALLKEIGSPLTPVEIDSYILDAAYARELEFEDFFARAFGREKLRFTDEAQQAVFYNYVEDRFEDLTGNYDRYGDEAKAPLRTSILECVDERLEFFDYLASVEKNPDQLPQKSLHRLAEIALRFGEVLKMLNDPACTPAESELEELADAIAAHAEEQAEVIAELSDSFARNE